MRRESRVATFLWLDGVHGENVMHLTSIFSGKTQKHGNEVRMCSTFWEKSKKRKNKLQICTRFRPNEEKSKFML